MTGMKRLACAVLLLLLLVIAGGFVRYGGRYWRAYATVMGLVEAEQDYVERVKREAGEQ